MVDVEIQTEIETLLNVWYEHEQHIVVLQTVQRDLENELLRIMVDQEIKDFNHLFLTCILKKGGIEYDQKKLKNALAKVVPIIELQNAIIAEREKVTIILEHVDMRVVRGFITKYGEKVTKAITKAVISIKPDKVVVKVRETK